MQRLPEVQQLVRSLAAENDGLREEVESLQRACSALSRENGTLETRLEHSSSKRKRTVSEEEDRPRQRKPMLQQLGQHAAEHRGAREGFVLPDLNIPAAAPDDVGSAP